MISMRVGETLIWRGRVYRAVGFEPMSLPDRTAELLDVLTGERIHVPMKDLVRAEPAA
jgi:hypothetical protein